VLARRPQQPVVVAGRHGGAERQETPPAQFRRNEPRRADDRAQALHGRLDRQRRALEQQWRGGRHRLALRRAPDRPVVRPHQAAQQAEAREAAAPPALPCPAATKGATITGCNCTAPGAGGASLSAVRTAGA
jgi:hypothetical protein